MLPSSLDQSLKSSKRAHSGKNSNPLPASASFPRNPSIGYRDGVESVASISTRIWQDFPLMSFSPWLFKGITGYQFTGEALRALSTLEGPIWRPSFQGRYGIFKLVWKDLTKPSRTIFSSVPVDCEWDTYFWSSVLLMDPPQEGAKLEAQVFQISGLEILQL